MDNEKNFTIFFNSFYTGKVTSYGAIAKLLRSSPRAVGQALRRNPFAPIVPWYDLQFATSLTTPLTVVSFISYSHRVVAANGALCGFNGSPCCMLHNLSHLIRTSNLTNCGIGEPNSKKGSLLLKEGVKITVNKLTGEALVDKEYMIDEDTLRDLVRRDRSAAAQ